MVDNNIGQQLNAIDKDLYTVKLKQNHNDVKNSKLDKILLGAQRWKVLNKITP